MAYKHKIIVLIVFIWLCSCGYYSFKGALPSHIKTVAIPLFENNTAYPNVAEDLTNMLIDEIIADNSLKITDEGNADLIISGTITSIPLPKAAIVSGGEEVEQYKQSVKVKVKCEDVKNNKALWERSFDEFGILEASSVDDDAARAAAIQVAMEKITEDILNNTLGYW